MRILIYGPGVLGSVLGARLIQAGHDVVFLARGQRLENLRQHGLILESLMTGVHFQLPAQVIDHLAPEDAYHLVVVPMGAHQVQAVLPALAIHPCSPNVLFLGNSLSGPDALVSELGKERVLRGFYAVGGKLEGQVVYFADGTKNRKGRLTMGELDGRITPRLERFAGLFTQAGIPINLSENIDAWLKTHAALIVPLAGGVYLAGDNVALSQNRPAVLLVLQALREALLTLRVMGIPILPSGARLYELMPEELLAPILQRLFGTKVMSYAFSHADKARPEMAVLANELLAMMIEAGVPAPAMEELREAI